MLHRVIRLTWHHLQSVYLIQHNMTEKTHHNFTVVPDEHAEKIKEKGITIAVDTKKDAEKKVDVDKAK